MRTTIACCYDSHVHWRAMGEFLHRLSLRSLQKPEDVQQLQVRPHHFRGEWLVGFGWDQSVWAKVEFPTRFVLDAVFPDHPVALSRADGHVLWVNSKALEKADLLKPVEGNGPSGGKIIRDDKGVPTGVFIDAARALIDQRIPPFSAAEVKQQLLEGARSFHDQGFTHIRDMEGGPHQWEQALALAEAQELNLVVDQFFGTEDAEGFDRAFERACAARRHPSPFLRACGLKVFVDGALGSEGAWLSQPYPSGSGHGLQLLTKTELQEMMRRSWEAHFAIAVHAIGDEAAHFVATTADDLRQQGHIGELHLEHAQILRPETIALLRDLRTRCHLQPCHWLSDQKWLAAKLGSLYSYAFPWRALEEQGVTFDFGSDAPIETASVKSNWQACEQSAHQGIAPLKNNFFRYHQHPDADLFPDTYTEFEELIPQRVYFRGRCVYSR